MEKKDNKRYEITFWLKDESTAGVKEALQKNGVEIFAEKELRKMQLGYPIRRESYAFLGTIEFSVNPEAVQKIRETLNSGNFTLRYIITVAGERKTAERSEFSTFRERSAYAPSFKKKEEGILTNESLEKKIEEILN